MSAFDKIFGLILILAGVAIFIGYTLFIITPHKELKHALPLDHDLVPDKSWLFKFPSVCLALGVFLIWVFIVRTNEKIASKKAADAKKKAEEEALKKGK